MAVLKQRLHRKNADGTYDTIYLENSTINTLVDFAQASTPGVTLDTYLKSIGLGLTSALISDTNITDFASRPSGFYRGKNVTGAPEDSPDYYHYIWLKDSDVYGKLLAFKYTRNVIFTCIFNNGTWENWIRIGYDNTAKLGTNIFDILTTDNKIVGKIDSLSNTNGKLITIRNSMDSANDTVTEGTPLYRGIQIYSRDSNNRQNPEKIVRIVDRVGTGNASTDFYTYRPLISNDSGTPIVVSAGSSFIDVAKRGTGIYQIQNPSDPPDGDTNGFYIAVVLAVNANARFNIILVFRTNNTIYRGLVNSSVDNITWTKIYPVVGTWG